MEIFASNNNDFFLLFCRFSVYCTSHVMVFVYTYKWRLHVIKFKRVIFILIRTAEPRIILCMPSFCLFTFFSIPFSLSHLNWRLLPQPLRIFVHFMKWDVFCWHIHNNRFVFAVFSPILLLMKTMVNHQTFTLNIKLHGEERQKHFCFLLFSFRWIHSYHLHSILFLVDHKISFIFIWFFPPSTWQRITKKKKIHATAHCCRHKHQRIKYIDCVFQHKICHVFNVFFISINLLT